MWRCRRGRARGADVARSSRRRGRARRLRTWPTRSACGARPGRAIPCLRAGQPGTQRVLNGPQGVLNGYSTGTPGPSRGTQRVLSRGTPGPSPDPLPAGQTGTGPPVQRQGRIRAVKHVAGLCEGPGQPHLRRAGRPPLHQNPQPCHICAGTGLTPATSAPGLGSPPATSAQGWPAPLRQNRAIHRSLSRPTSAQD
jgi:hypothetical protein